MVLALLLAEVAVFAVSTLPGVRSDDGFHPLIDGWVQGAGYVTAALLACLRPFTPRGQRAVWSWMAAGVLARALGFVLFLVVVRPQQPRPFPSVADAAWLAMYVFVLVGLVGLARLLTRAASTSLILDGAVGALATAAVAVSLLYATVLSLAAPGTAGVVVAVDLAYPVLDLMLLAVILGLLMVVGRRSPPAVWALAAGIVAIAVIDGIVVYQSATGTFRPGTPLSSLALAAMALVASAGWLPHGERPGRREPLPSVVLPALFALVCLGLLVFATRHRIPVLGVVLAGAGVAVAIARTGLSFRAVRALAEHRREARTDELTGLANRRSFNERLARATASRPPDGGLGLLVIDLDDFKAVNDSLGHHYGDELLRLVAPRLRQVVRGEDTVARLGGDEFAVLLAGADAERAIHVAERLRAGFRRPFRLGPHVQDISASIGIAVAPEDGQEPVELLQHADLAMYEAKISRSGHARHRPEPAASGRARLQSSERLRQAIQDGELELLYQPQVSLRSGKVVGVEALVRWRHPESGLLLPTAFLPQAESAGLMPMLTHAVLGQAVRQGAAWRAAGDPVTIAVNLSVTNLLDPQFPDQVIGLLAGAGLPGSALELELTEDLFMADPSRARSAVRTLLEAGVSLVIDDYGTGYSSLGYLRDLRDIRGLKLDRSFVTHLDADPRAEAIVESTVTLAHSLGMAVVAEGVETVEVRDRLAAFGCEVAQGFLFSRPVPADEIVFGVLEAAPPVR
ncbi:MAG: putative signaling protein [Blastococcus sp.]|nr:putative signaling protein [Blastococcus sp.]